MEGTTLEPGTLVEHRYLIRRFIAAGGVAQVYAATHRITGREVALKMPRTDGVRDPLVHERLLREGHAVARAKHPGVVEIVDAGEYNGAPYLVFELLEGRTLGGLLAARSRLSWEEVAFIGQKIAEVVGHCHQRGVIHRDLKPDNIFVLPTAIFSLKLFDFGIAQLAPAAEGESKAKLTQVGSIVGTPEYMAPEALQMDGDQDQRVDIYSLGVILFELLTGSVPFEGRYADVLIRLSTQPLPSLAKLRADVPANLVAAVERCLARDKAARFANMADVSLALASMVLPLPAAPVGGGVTRADAAPGDGTGTKRTQADTPAAFKAAPAVGKRRFARAPYTTPAQLTLPGGEVVAGQVEEISEGGVQFIAPRGLAAGEKGDFRFAEPLTGKVLRTGAVSRWTKAARAGRHATGFEFQGVSEESRASIRKYVELMGGS
ncbi:MAG TPA: serine/threonine-protein kinase [Polyangiaceae bacterium]|nr:serine/threonine-protein kinase [Polyangiaceae bacterium]